MAGFHLKPIEKETTKEKVYHQIKQVVLNGQLSANEIFTEVKMAEHLNTSRTPVREALQDLLKEGLLITVPRKGLAVRKVTKSEVEQIFFLREAIEKKVVQKVSGTITERQLNVLKTIYHEQEEMMQNNDEISFINLDQKFHITLAVFADYELVKEILLNLHNLTHLIGLQALKKENRMKEVLDEHLSIIEALQSGEADAATRCVELHLAKTNESIHTKWED
ncbi:GntR family transcriptional regulator [Brevibacillus fluminis]|uniref:GntR family transcriptional regulator n=1 Tax=Brevibacillus fluminis TaxID=511487 RepID=A0A3M8D9B8_9BACL|nr:GntR family transcriptional regulator [Brevibacillus fluminis]RNB84632.1 GntR family transcriptional regulator [Brevibacillus fluminis]